MSDEHSEFGPATQPGRVIARTVQIDVTEKISLSSGYRGDGWDAFLLLGGWKARVAVFILKLLR